MNAFNQQWEKWFPEQEPVSPQPPKRGGHQGINYLYIFGLVVLLFVIISMLKTVYADWLWFKSLGYETVYMTVLQARVLVFICTALIFGIFFAGNLLLAQRLASGQSAGMRDAA